MKIRAGRDEGAAQASVVTQTILWPVVGLGTGVLAGEAVAAPEEAATFFHYGYMADDANFAGGLNRVQGVPNAVYPVTPEPGTPMNGPSTVQRANGHPGRAQTVNFQNGTGSGTLGPPKPIPPQ